MTTSRQLFGEILLKRRAVSREQLEAALAQQQGTSRGIRLGELLVALGYLAPDNLSVALSEQLGIPAFTSGMRPDPVAVQCVPFDFASAQLVLPVALSGDVLTVATPFPDDAEVLAFVAGQTGKRVAPMAASSATVRQAIAEAYHTMSAVEAQVQAYEDTRPALPREEGTLAAITEDAPVVRIVNILLTEGLRERASDVHLEPQRDRIRVRFRVDGALRDMQNLPLSLGPALVSRIKVMAEMDIVERHRSQDGQIAVQVEGRAVDVRVATTETIWGEKVVLRLLDRTRSVMGLADLGMPEEIATRFVQLVHVPFGMIVVAGPTGSGKTTTLYASLNELDRHERNITTIEDPVEYVFPDIVQIQIRPSAGRTFADGLRAILRQDPDVILVGEVRDTETAEIATQAALTGHTVFCSVHATDAVAALHRFLDMGVESYLLAPATEAIVAQRLVRRICPGCAQEYTPPQEELALYKQVTGDDRTSFWRGAGCPACRGTGYYERVGVYELLRLDETVKGLVIRQAPLLEIREAAEATGMVPLRRAAMAKVAANETTIAEVIRTVYAG